jgi:hypothetical protein
VIAAADVERAVASLREVRPGAWVSADGLYRVHEADLAVMLGFKPRALRAWREEGRGPAFHLVGPRPTYAIADVLAWLQTRRHDPRA